MYSQVLDVTGKNYQTLNVDAPQGGSRGGDMRARAALFRPGMTEWNLRCRVDWDRFSNSGSLTMLAAMRRAPSLVSRSLAARRAQLLFEIEIVLARSRRVPRALP
jgi:hypothetical protein